MCPVEGFCGKHSLSVFKRLKRRCFSTVYLYWLSVGLFIVGLFFVVVCIVEGFCWKYALSFFKKRRCLEIVYVHRLSVGGRQLEASKRRRWRKDKVLVILSKRRRWRKHNVLVIHTTKSLRAAKCARISQHEGILCSAAMQSRRIGSYRLRKDDLMSCLWWRGENLLAGISQSISNFISSHFVIIIMPSAALNVL